MTNHLTLPVQLRGGGVGGYPHYTDKETEARSLIDLLQVIQMAELEFEARPSCAQSPF